jgi:hypothetical protein
MTTASADVSPEQQSVKTRRVRIKVIMNSEGQWGSYSWHNCTDDEPDEVPYDMMGENDILTARVFWVNADLPLPPDAIEVDASSIEAADPDPAAQVSF